MTVLNSGVTSVRHGSSIGGNAAVFVAVCNECLF
jgi:hypothetical protein